MDIFKPTDAGGKGVRDAESGKDPSPPTVVLDVREDDEKQADTQEYHDAYQGTQLNKIAKNSEKKEEE